MEGYKYQIVCVCKKCGKEITRSKVMSKKELEEKYQFAVLSAPLAEQIKCKDCGRETPNFNLDFKIARVKDGKEELFTPESIMKKLEVNLNKKVN